MKLKRINVLGLQETHLTPTHLASVQALYSRLLIFNSPDPDNAGASAGIAFAVNKAITRTDQIRFVELVPGRAALLTINWRENESTSVLNVYAPNSPSEHPAFWRAVSDALKANNIHTIDFMVGDYNLVEDEIDRTPTRPDRPSAVEALRDFRAAYSLQDTWRHDHLNHRMFTYRTVRGTSIIQSRLDRIYTSESKSRYVYEWDQVIGCVPSDHDMISVRYAPANATATGPGRWTMPLHLLTNPAFLSEIKTRGRELEATLADVADTRTPTHNAQTLWADFKSDLRTAAKKHASKTSGKLANKIKTLTSTLDRLTNDPDFATDTDLRTESALKEDSHIKSANEGEMVHPRRRC
ncbi:DNase I-like protein [Auriscalpium vulgare]|uniref:DNase I-like protein n=1 Tax=Auriscalpium vulgare TaxID=40419 RepID=A0ACB8R2P3_9AGAM|nr:DNase I-like protein [Auriscalpium vulgare]